MDRRQPRQRFSALSVSALVSVLFFGTALGDAQFVDVSASRGIGLYAQQYGMGSGIAAADFDDDGDIDLFVPTAAGMADQLYRNLGDGNFEEIGLAAGLASMQAARGALWVDYDGDQRLDLVVTADCWKLPDECAGVAHVRLYRQVADAEFQDVTIAAGLSGLFPEDPDTHTAGLIAGDINGDGWLDLLISEWLGSTRLMINNGDGTFSDAGSGSGIILSAEGHWQAMMHDFNGDGELDIYSAIDFTRNHLWINDGSGSFTDQALTSGVNNGMNDMGISLADWDNDGDLDIYVTNIAYDGKHNVFLRNDSTPGDLQFSEISQALGVDDGGWGWGTTALDVDNDGWLDLAATNGFGTGNTWPYDSSKFFLNSATTPLAFTDISATSGFNDTLWGSALVAIDHDRDGDLDLIQTCNGSGVQPPALRILDNQSVGAASNNYIVIKPRLAGPNHRAIGAVVRITVGSLQMMRLISAGTSFLGQEPAEAFFGLGSAVTVDQITVEWPDGTTTQQSNVTANQVQTFIKEPDADSDGIINGNDCAPLNGQAWDSPGEALTVVLSGSSSTTITWNPPIAPGGLSLTYDTIASGVSDDFDAAAICVESAGSDTETVDTVAIPPGAIRHYLVRAANPCGFGSGGMTSTGVPRTLLECL